MQRLIVGITGATGAIFGVRLLQALEGSGIETHLVISKWALQTIEHEVSLEVDAIRALATVNHEPGNFNAPIASGSFRVDGMVIAPCSVRSLGAIAHGNGDTLIHRAADVVLKERRRLVLLVREMPLSTIHLENMLTLARMGATIMPPMPAFYNHPQSVEDIVDHVVARTLDQLDLPAPFAKRWGGAPRAAAVPLRRKR
jgi:4-hydroxy-3-polyprenylbenzoate decarboxylase